MNFFKNIIKSHYLIGTLYYSLPNLFSILISIISIPIYLNFLTPEEYANYLISHFVLTIAIITNLNFNRIATINIAKKNSNKNDIVYTSLFFTSIFSTTISIIIFYLFVYFIKYFNLENIQEITDIKILIGLIITNFYLTLEGIFKGNLNYKSLSFFNLSFYSISLSFPALTIYYESSFNIFAISILIKFIVIVAMLIVTILKIAIKKSKISKPYIKDCKIGLKWMTLNTTLNQIYNYFDKYIIKVFLDSSAFVFYNVSQQITSKLGSPIMSYNNIFIAKTNSNNKNNNNHLSMASIFYCIYTFVIFLSLYYFLENFLKLWLGETYSINYYNLIKIFILISIMNAFSSLLIDFYDLSNKSKFNSYVEIILLLPFIFGIIISVLKSSIYYFVFVIFFKELVVLAIRFYKINNFFIYKKLILFQFFILIINSILWFNNYNIEIFILIQFIHLIVFLPFKKMKKFYKI